ncbi:MAG: hypothetical protein AAF570_27160, partial [Bacteroidota bacterium]
MKEGEKVIVLSGPYQGIHGEVLRSIPGGYLLLIRILGEKTEVEIPTNAIHALQDGSILPLLERRIRADIELGFKALLEAWWAEQALLPDENRAGEWLAFAGFRDLEMRAWTARNNEIRVDFQQQFHAELEKEMGPGPMLRRFEHEAERWLPHRAALEAAYRKDELGPEGLAHQRQLAARRRWYAWRAWWKTSPFHADLPESARMAFQEFRQPDLEAAPDDDTRRRIALHNAFINDFGLCGISEVLAPALPKATLFHLDGVPETCPWAGLAGLPLEEALRQLYGANLPAAAPFAVRLDHCLKALFAMRIGQRWYLGYVCNYRQAAWRGGEAQRTPGTQIFFGGAPKKAVRVPKGVNSPNAADMDALKAFYRVHDGFGRFMRAADLFG